MRSADDSVTSNPERASAAGRRYQMKRSLPRSPWKMGWLLAASVVLALLPLGAPKGFGASPQRECEKLSISKSQVANLGLSQSASFDGANVRVKYTVSNFGPCAAHQTTLTVLMPTDYVFVKADSLKGDWTCAPSDTLVTCTLQSTLPHPGENDRPGLARVAITATPPEMPMNDTFDAVIISSQKDPDCDGLCFGEGSDNEALGGFAEMITTGSSDNGHTQTTSVTRPNENSIAIQQLDPSLVKGAPCNPCLDGSRLVFITTPSTSPDTPLQFTFLIPDAVHGQSVTVVRRADKSKQWVEVAPCSENVDPCVESVLFTPYSPGYPHGFLTITVLSSTNGGWGNS